jgi:putative thioredoxin
MADVLEISDEQFETEVIDKSNQEKVVVDFWAPWCAPCKMLGPVLEDVCSELGLTLVKVNVDNNKKAAMEYGVRGIPAVKVFKDGEVSKEFVGAQPEQEVRSLLS